MIFKNTIAAFLLIAASLAGAKERPETFELFLNDIRLPVSASGMITFRACSDCEFQRALANDDTLWMLNNQATTFDQLRSGSQAAASPEQSMVTLFFDKEANRVTQLRVWTR